MSKSAIILGVVYSAAVLSTVSAQIGSPAWTAAWPPSDQSKTAPFLPAWQADFNSISFTGTATAPVVPSGQVGKANAQFCDWSYNLCDAPTDVFQCTGPRQWGLTFDDGPIAPQSQTLYTFLAANNQKATHFMIGTNIVTAPALVQQAFSQGNHIAVHTWTHHAMTTLDSQTAYAELRWPIEIIKNITGATPLWWRPPYGDVDDRIRAIATHLNLTTTLWNQDTNDWCIGDPTASADGCGNFQTASVSMNLEAWAANQTAAPNGVVCLEHELSVDAVAQFIQAYPTLKSNGWNIGPVATCNNRPFYAESMAPSSSVPANTTAAATATNNVTANPANANASATGSSTPPAKSSASLLTFGAFSALAVFVSSVVLL